MRMVARAVGGTDYRDRMLVISLPVYHLTDLTPTGTLVHVFFLIYFTRFRFISVLVLNILIIINELQVFFVPVSFRSRNRQ